MRFLFLMVLSVLLLTVSRAQDIVNWKYFTKKIADKTYEIHLTATIESPWHIYSQHLDKDALGLPTTISFNRNPLIYRDGEIKEIGKVIIKREEVTDTDFKYYSDQVDFVQVVKLKKNIKTNIGGSIAFMTCTDERCLLPKTINFSVEL